jgi:hypothetical protein
MIPPRLNRPAFYHPLFLLAPCGETTRRKVDDDFVLAVLEKYVGGPVGLGTLPAAKEMHERYLMRIGMLRHRSLHTNTTTLAANFPPPGPLFRCFLSELRALVRRQRQHAL